MPNHLTLTAIYESVEDGWIQGRIFEIPGVITAAPTRDEAKNMIRDALTEYLASYRSHPVVTPRGAEREEIKLTIAG